MCLCNFEEKQSAPVPLWGKSLITVWHLMFNLLKTLQNTTCIIKCIFRIRKMYEAAVLYLEHKQINECTVQTRRSICSAYVFYLKKPCIKYDDACIHFRRYKFSPLVSRLMQDSHSRDALRWSWSFLPTLIALCLLASLRCYYFDYGGQWN